MFCSYSFEKLLCWTCWLTASIHRWTQRPCESQRSWNDRKVALFWFWSTLQREHFNLPSCFKTTFWPCEWHKSCLVSRQTTLTTAHGRSEQVWETWETAKYHRLDFNKHSENTQWACFFFICLGWTRCTSVSLTLGNDLSRPQIEKNADTSGNRGDSSAQEMSNPPKPTLHAKPYTLHNSMSRSRSGESSQDCGCRLKKQSFLSADLMVCRIIYVYRLCDEDELTNNDDNRAEPIPDKHDLEVN